MPAAPPASHRRARERLISSSLSGGSAGDESYRGPRRPPGRQMPGVPAGRGGGRIVAGASWPPLSYRRRRNENLRNVPRLGQTAPGRCISTDRNSAYNDRSVYTADCKLIYYLLYNSVRFSAWSRPDFPIFDQFTADPSAPFPLNLGPDPDPDRQPRWWCWRPGGLGNRVATSPTDITG
jgi:hypothetical protein